MAYEARRPDELLLDPDEARRLPPGWYGGRRTFGDGPVRVVHLWGLDSARATAETRELEESIRRACESVLCLVQAMTEAEPSAPSRLWLATRGAQAAAGAESPPSALAQSPLWGFGRVEFGGAHGALGRVD